MEGFITEPNDIYLWNIVTYGAHRRHRLLFIICKYHSIFLCVTTGSVALLVYKPFVYFIISLSNKVLLFNSRTPDYSTKVCGAFQLSLKASLFLLRVIRWHSVGPIGVSFFIHHGYLLTFLRRASKVFPSASMCPPPPPTSHDDSLVVSSDSICPPPPPTSHNNSLVVSSASICPPRLVGGLLGLHHLPQPLSALHPLPRPLSALHHLPQPLSALHHLPWPLSALPPLPRPPSALHHLPRPPSALHHLPQPSYALH